MLLPFNFKKIFWLQVRAFVVKSLSNSFRKGELSSVQNEGVLLRIRKGDKAKDLYLIKIKGQFHSLMLFIKWAQHVPLTV